MKNLFLILMVATLLCIGQARSQSAPDRSEVDEAAVLRTAEMAAEKAIEAAIAAMPPKTDNRPSAVIFCEDVSTAAKGIYHLKEEGRPLLDAVRYVRDVWSFDDRKRYVVVSGLALVIFSDRSIDSQAAATALAENACANES